MATVLDNLGREFIDANRSLNEIKDLLGSLMQKTAGPAKPVTGISPEPNNAINEIRDLLKSVVTDFEKEAKEQEKFTKEVIDGNKEFLEAQEKAAKIAKAKSKKEKSDKPAKPGRMNLGSLPKLSSGNMLKVYDPYVVDAINKLCFCIGKSGTRSRGKSNHEEIEGDKGLSKFERKNSYINLHGLKTLIHQFDRFSDKVQEIALGFRAWDVIIDGTVRNEREFTQEIRAIAFETTGATKESNSLQKSYEKIDKAVALTGVDRTKYQQSYKKNVKSGIKDLKLVNALTTQHLHTEFMIGAEAGSLNEEFKDWVQAGKMTTSQMAEMGRGIKQVARDTGITGDELVGVVKSSQSLVKSLRNAGTFTTSIAKNMLLLSANAKKLDIEEVVGKIQKALNDPFHLRFEADPKFKAFLFRSAQNATEIAKGEGRNVNRAKDLQEGTLSEQGGLKDFARGMEADILKMANGLKTVHGEQMKTLDEFYQLDSESRTQLINRYKLSTGENLAEIMRAVEGYKEAGKSLDERIGDLNKKFLLEPNKKELIAKGTHELKNDASMGILNEFIESSKGAKNMAETQKKFEVTRKPVFDETLNTLGTNSSDTKEILRKNLQAALDGLNTSLKVAKKDTVDIDPKDFEKALNDTTTLKAVYDKLEAGQKALSIEQKTELDPITSAAQSLKEINEKLRIMSQSFFSKMFDTLTGKVIVVAAILTSILSTLAAYFAESFIMMSAIEKFTGLHLFKGRGVKGANPKSNSKIGGMLDDITEGASTAFETIGKNVGKSSDGLAARISRVFNTIAEEGFSGLIRVTNTGFNGVMSSVSTKLGGITGFITRQIGNVRTAFTSSWTSMIGSWNQMVSNVKASKFAKSIPDLIKNTRTALKGKSFISGAAHLGNMGTKGVGRVAGAIAEMGTKGLGQGLRGLGALVKMGGKLSPFFLLSTAIDAVMGTFDGAAKAGKFFGKELKDVTLNQEYAAKSAGMLTGILNGLTFGLFGLFFEEQLDSVTGALARAMAAFPILTVIFGTVVVAIEAVYGIIKGIVLGIWEILKGIWDGVMEIVNPIVEGINNIFTAIFTAIGFKQVEGQVGFLVQTFRDLGGVIGIVSEPIRLLGVAIGWVFRIVGKVIGFVIKTILSFVEGLMVVFEPIGEVFGEIGSIFSEIFTDVSNIFGELSSSLSPIFKEIYKGLQPVFEMFGGGGEWTGFFDIVKDIGKWVGWLVANVLRVFLWQIIMIAKVFSAIAKVVTTFYSIFAKFLGLFTGKTTFSEFSKDFFSMINGLVKDVGWKLFEGITYPLKGLGKEMYDNIIGGLANLGGAIYDMFTGALGNAWGWFTGSVKEKQLQEKQDAAAEKLKKAIASKDQKGIQEATIVLAELEEGRKKDAGNTWIPGTTNANDVKKAKELNEQKNIGIAKNYNLDLENQLKGKNNVDALKFLKQEQKLNEELIHAKMNLVANSTGKEKELAFEQHQRLTKNRKSLAEVVEPLEAKLNSEIAKVQKELNINKTQQTVRQKSIEDSKSTNAPTKLINAEKIHLENLKNKEKTLMQQLEVERKKALTVNPASSGVWIDPKAAQKSLNSMSDDSATKGWQYLKARNARDKAELQIKTKDLKNGETRTFQNGELKKISEDSATTAETMKMGQKEGSIYVHDTHLESLITSLFNQFDLDPNRTTPTTYALPIGPTSPLSTDMHTAVAGEKISTEPDKVEVVATELSEIADDAAQQTDQLNKVIGLLTQLVAVLQPTGTVLTSSGANIANTAPNKVTRNKVNYHRNTVGLATQGPARSVLNVGTPVG